MTRLRFPRILPVACISLLSAASGASPRAQQSTGLPLVIERAWIEPADPQTGRPAQAYVTVRNAGDRVITAWSFWAEIRFADRATQRSGNTIDTVAAGSGGKRAVLTPAARYTQRMAFDLPSTATDVAAIPAVVVFDDDTALGDEELISTVFRFRALRQRFWQALRKILADVTGQVTDSTVALQSIEAHLDAEADPDVRSIAVYTEVRRRISPDVISRLKQSPAQVLQQLAREAATRGAEADAHHHRRR